MTTSADPHAPAPRWTSYVAVGDSFTEGLWDTDPAAPDRCRGWADRLAASLSARRVAAGQEPLRYANLAVRGKLLGPIIDDQLPRALDLGPDLVSLVGGGNDILRPRADVDALSQRLEDAVARVRATGADVLVATGFDTAESPVVSLTRSRVGVYDTNVWSIARRQGAYVLDLWGMRSLKDWRVWAPDRIHLTDEGHRRVADAALVGLGLAPDDAAWDEPLAPLPRAPFSERARENARWAREYVGPWVGRRLRHESSGDGRAAKYPDLTDWT
ncbi:SGNH hydrolase [Luteimicrobium album]|uniref:SGNH hydrolase n=1 Tax=Luteimicrobium album TaxID=1054550 RepID=A0ABQ6I352_9MICO|nr:SGNH/GDSL hydrolase family protein [Luteimicrobium album]GMA24691.1 SGNH hydrolase [Luteimicrobium album]